MRLIERMHIGDRKTVIETVEPGDYPNGADSTVKVLHTVRVPTTYEWQYTYPNLKEKPVWMLASRDWDRAVAKGQPEPVPEQVPGEPDTYVRPPWYKRWLGLGPRAPRAVVVRCAACGRPRSKSAGCKNDPPTCTYP